MPRWLMMLLVVLVYQILIYTLFRSLRWMSVGRVGWPLAFVLFALGNGLFVVMLLRILPGMFSVQASVLALLWFWFLCCVVIWMLHGLSGGRYDSALKWLLPVLMIALCGYGWFNAHNPAVRHYTITLDKAVTPLRIALVSDFHLGAQVGNAMLEKLVAIIEAESPDMILMPGDVIDNDASVYREKQMQARMQKITAPLGVYASMGNHEFYGDSLANAQAIRDGGVVLLRDQAVVVADKLVVIGREDEHVRSRKSLEELLSGVDARLPVIVMDHRPTEILPTSTLPVDIQVSGHTHRGQIFPANWITQAMYRLDYGHEAIGNGHFFTTSGYGFWGVPMRLGSRSEVVIIDVEGKNPAQ